MLASIRSQLVAGFLAVAAITLVGNLVGVFGLDSIHRRTLEASERSWPTADMCMEYWIGSLSRARAIQRLKDGHAVAAEAEARWASQFIRNSLDRLRVANMVSPEQLDQMERLNQVSEDAAAEYFLAFDDLATRLAEAERVRAGVAIDIQGLRAADPATAARLNELRFMTATPIRLSVAAGPSELEQLVRWSDTAEERLDELHGVFPVAALAGAREGWARLVETRDRLFAARKRLWAADVELESALQTVHALIEPIEDKMDLAMDHAGRTTTAIARNLRLQQILVAITSVLVAIALSVYLSARLIKPLRRLTEMTRRIAAGHLDESVGIARRDEIGTLARHFDEMAGRLARFQGRLVASEASYRALFEHTGHAIVVADEHARIVAANSAFGELTGRELDRLPGTEIGALLVEENGESATSALETAAADEVLELRVRRSDDSLIPAQASASHLPDGRLVLHIQNVSEYRRMQQALMQGEKLSAIGQLAAGIAHELRNPLFVISNIMDDLRANITEPSDDVVEDLAIADQENRRARKIIDNLLEFARPADPAACALQPSIELNRVLHLFDELFSQRGITLEADLAARCMCRFHPDAFKQVLVNLISNAIDAMPDGGRLEATTRDLADGRIEVRIADSGHGMPPEVRNQIFNPFFSTKDPGKGTGLGLSIVHSSVRAHDGKLEVESAPGTGTKFSLLLQGTLQKYDEPRRREA